MGRIEPRIPKRVYVPTSFLVRLPGFRLRVQGTTQASVLLQTMPQKPLVGDIQGRYKIAIVGNSGSGKTTLAAHLSSVLNVPCLSLDHILWNPGWIQTPNAEFRSRVHAYMDEHPNGWVIDGNCHSHIGTMVQDAATDILWLDPPLLLNFWRILQRTFSRMIGTGPSCAPGCNETIASVFFARDSILWWCLSRHHIQRERNIPKWEKECSEKGQGRWRRFNGWGSDVSAWLDQVKEMVGSA